MAIGRVPRAGVRPRRAVDDSSIGLVPYSGATSGIDLGAYTFTTTGIITGGTFTDGTLTIVGGDLSTTGTLGSGTITLTADSDLLLSGTGHVTSGSEGFIVGTLTITDGSIDDTDGTIDFGATNLTSVGSVTMSAAVIGSLSGILKATTGTVSGAAALNDLADVNAGAPTDNDSLTWDSGTSKWIPEAVSAGSLALDDLTDVEVAGALDRDVLAWNSGAGGWRRLDVDGIFVPYTGATVDVDLGTFDIAATEFKTKSVGGHIIIGGRAIVSTGTFITFSGTDLMDVGDLGVGTGSPDTSLQVVGDSKFGDDDTNYATIGTTGDLTFVGTAGLQFGSCFAELPAIWTQANAVQNTWYDISDADFQDGKLHGVTHNGNGQLTVAVAGMYMADWAGAVATNITNVHVRVTFSINGTEGDPGMNHIETVAAGREFPCGGLAILDLAASDTVNMSIKTTDSGTPDLMVEHLMFRLIQIGGT